MLLFAIAFCLFLIREGIVFARKRKRLHAAAWSVVEQSIAILALLALGVGLVMHLTAPALHRPSITSIRPSPPPVEMAVTRMTREEFEKAMAEYNAIIARCHQEAADLQQQRLAALSRIPGAKKALDDRAGALQRAQAAQRSAEQAAGKARAAAEAVAARAEVTARNTADNSHQKAAATAERTRTRAYADADAVYDARVREITRTISNPVQRDAAIREAAGKRDAAREAADVTLQRAREDADIAYQSAYVDAQEAHITAVQQARDEEAAARQSAQDTFDTAESAAEEVLTAAIGAIPAAAQLEKEFTDRRQQMEAQCAHDKEEILARIRGG